MTTKKTTRKRKRISRRRKKKSPLNGFWTDRSEMTRTHIHSWLRLIIAAAFVFGLGKGCFKDEVTEIVRDVNAPFFQEINDQQNVMQHLQESQDRQYQTHREDMQEVDEDFEEVKSDIKDGFKEIKEELRDKSG